MMTRLSSIHSRRFFFLVVGISLVGFLVFSSASLGLLGRDSAGYNRIIWNQFTTFLLGLVILLAVGRVPYKYWRSFSVWFFIVSLVLTALVFVPNLGLSLGGARRWLSLGARTFQPSELLKIGFVIYLSAWLAKNHERVTTWRSGFLPFLIFTGLAGGLLFLQPDIGTSLVLFSAGFAVFFVAGASWRQIGALILIALIGFSSIVAIKPYAKQRVFTFLNPDQKTDTISWQVNQSLLAIGSGEIFGRGFGQSLQKFSYLPQPIGDSVFAVAGEEFGFFGGILLIIAFALFALWGLGIARRAPDRFGRFLVTGLVVLMITGAFVNIGSMLGLMPLTGIPLLFISHGGSALLLSMFGCGIILNVARSSKV